MRFMLYLYTVCFTAQNKRLFLREVWMIQHRYKEHSLAIKSLSIFKVLAIKNLQEGENVHSFNYMRNTRWQLAKNHSWFITKFEEKIIEASFPPSFFRRKKDARK